MDGYFSFILAYDCPTLFKDMESDLAYVKATEIEQDFIDSGYDDITKSYYQCVSEFMNDFYGIRI